jgi:hypothetical protein
VVLTLAAKRAGDTDALAEIQAIKDTVTAFSWTVTQLFDEPSVQARIDALGVKLAGELSGINPLDLPFNSQLASPTDNAAISGSVAMASSAAADAAGNAITSAWDAFWAQFSWLKWVAIAAVLILAISWAGGFRRLAGSAS